MTDGLHKRTRYQRPAAWLGLCAMLFLQIQIAGHVQFEHDSLGDHEEICEVCHKLDKSDGVPLADTATTIVEYAASAPTFRPALLFATRTKNPHSARGPPTA